MESKDYLVTPNPTDIVQALALAQDTRYSGQNISSTGTLYVRESATAPGPSDRFFKIEAGSFFALRPTGTGIWFWTDDPSGSIPIVIGEAA